MRRIRSASNGGRISPFNRFGLSLVVDTHRRHRMPVSLSNVADSHVPSLGGFLEGWSITQAIAAEPDYRNLLLGTSERLTRDRIGAGVGQLNLGHRSWAWGKDSDRATPAPSRPALCKKPRRSRPCPIEFS